MTSKSLQRCALGAAFALAGIAIVEIALRTGGQPLSPLGWPGLGIVVGALLGGLPAALAGAVVALGYAVQQFATPERFPLFFSSSATILAWIIGLGLAGALCVWVRARLDRLQTAELSLRESEDRFRHLTSLSSDWYWEIDADLRFTRIAGAGLAAFGLSEYRLIGKRAQEVSVYKLLSPSAEEFERLRELRRPYRDVRGLFVVEEMPNRYVSIDGDPIFDLAGRFRGYRGVTRDITDKFNAEQVIRDSEARFHALSDLSSDWYWEQDEHYRFVAFSAEVERASGVSVASHVGKTRWELPTLGLSDDDWVRHRATLNARQPFRDLEYMRVNDRGEHVWISVSGVPILDDAGRFTGYRGVARNVTERKRAELALADAKERLQRALESSDLSLWETDLRTGDVYLSEGWSELIGGPAEATRTTVDELMRLVHPVDLAATVLLSKETILGRRAAYSTEHRVHTHAGGWKWIRSAGKVSERDADGLALRVSGTNLDITARKLAENALRESEERFRSLTNMSSDWYWEQDESFRFTFMSGQLREKTGIDQQSHLGKTRWDMPASNVTEADWLRHKALLERHEPFVDFVMRRPDADGLQHWVSISGEPLFDEMKRFRGYRGIGRDVTAEHLARERIEHLNSELEERVRMRTAELETLVKELETFHFAIAHDLNTSLGVMSVSAGMLLHELGAGLAEEHQRALRKIAQNAELTARLLDDLLAYSRLGQETLNLEPAPMELLARDVWRRLSREKSERQLLFETTDLPACRGDQRMLSQLWSRLLSNAIKFTRTREQARIEAGYDASRNAYFVRDNGVGFDMQYADRLFGVFERLHHEEHFEGTGVGLAIVARIARRHGGRVWAQARPGEGATFWFSISGEAAP